ncbi:hypothetical protein A7982_12999 [Minicystis rosea]|nr:hypothetical protein A7982_12999 [Minicystis rosea]
MASTSAGGAGGTGGTGGTGGVVPPHDMVCVDAPVPSPFAGTDDCPAPQPDAPDALDEALAAGDIDRCRVRLLPEVVALSGWPEEMLVDRHRLPDFTPLHRGPLRLPSYARETRSFLDTALASASPVSGTLAALSTRHGHVIAGACVDLVAFAPAAEDTTPLATAVLLLDEHLGKPGDEAALRAGAMSVPLELQRRLARVIGALDHAVSETKAALGVTSTSDLRYLAGSHALYVPSITTWDTSAAGIAKLDGVDLDRLADAAALLARTIEEADFASLPDATFAPFEAETPVGSIVVHDAAADTYKKGSLAEKPLLLFDLGGDDTYEVPAGASDDKRPVSIAIDVRGQDTYGYAISADTADGDMIPSDGKGRYHSTKPPTEDYGPITLSRVARQGAGLAGIGMLFDLGAENDHYRSLALSQGFAAAGVGILYDAGGDDVYEAEAGAQGSAMFGIAALIDRAGHDTYRSFTMSQGFGGAVGVGALIDADGDDTYTVDIGDPMLGGHSLYFSPQLPGAGNSSMSQGAAQGRRPQSAEDAAYMAGGLGLLYDKQGKDKYTGSVFAQGVGYWQGIGMLIEGGGDDEYDALWYTQGSTAHFALSIFLEAGGDDRYDLGVVPAATSIGVGHDFSASIHLDEGGDDHYRGPGLSLGSGNINGIGCLVNRGGDDVFEAAGDPALGAGNYSAEADYGEDRQMAPTIGIFVHTGGPASYEVGGVSRPLADTTWSYEPQPYPAPQMVTTEHGCGADRPSGTVSLP